MHHALGRGAHPHLRAEKAILFQVCAGSRGHHREADRADRPLHWALQEAGLECLADSKGTRPWPTRQEVEDIIIRHENKAAHPHVSPVGRTD